LCFCGRFQTFDKQVLPFSFHAPCLPGKERAR
jgi:hypothetical protein